MSIEDGSCQLTLGRRRAKRPVALPLPGSPLNPPPWLAPAGVAAALLFSLIALGVGQVSEGFGFWVQPLTPKTN